MLNSVFVLFFYKILLFVDKFICECAQLKKFLNFTVLLCCRTFNGCLIYLVTTYGIRALV
jgi:hypothetical protein